MYMYITSIVLHVLLLMKNQKRCGSPELGNLPGMTSSPDRSPALRLEPLTVSISPVPCAALRPPESALPKLK